MKHWKQIPDFPGYEVSDFGDVRSWWTNSHTFAPEPHPLVPMPTHKGYLRIAFWKDGSQYFRSISRLVLKTFTGPCPKGMECCHNDSDNTNNRLDNLRWDTRESNWEDRRTNGFDGRGVQNGRAKLTPEQVADIRQRFAVGESYYQLADAFGIGGTTVGHIVNGRTWTHIGGPIIHAGKRRNLRLVRMNTCQD